MISSVTPDKEASANFSDKYLSPDRVNAPLETDSLEQQVNARLTYIEEFIAGKIRGASIKVQPPDFTTPHEGLKKSTQNEWVRIKNRYDNAVKLNELGSHFGRIQPIINDLKSLIVRVPSSASLRRCLAYFQFLAANTSEAIRNYSEVSFLTEEAGDWYNIAALALDKKPCDEALAVYALEQVFRHSSIANYRDAWYCYIGLLQTLGDGALLQELYSAIAQSISAEEEQYLLLASIYLLKYLSQENVARVLVRGILREKSSQELLREAMSHMVWPISKKYQQQKQSLDEARRLFLTQIKSVKQTDVPSTKVVRHQPASTPSLKAVADGKKKSVSLPQILPPQLQGQIIYYKKDRGHGSVHGVNGLEYYFIKAPLLMKICLSKSRV